MTLKSMLIAQDDGSSCGGGFCRKDERCRDKSCEGHPLGYEAGFLPLQQANGAIDTTEAAEVRGGMRLAALVMVVVVLVLSALSAWLAWAGWQMWPSFIVSLKSIGFRIF